MYVIDGPAIVSVAIRVADPSQVYLGMTDLLDAGQLCFPNEVLEELERTARNEQPLVWARGCSPNRTHKGAAYNYIEWVGHDFPRLIDTTARDTQESGAVYVVAQALALDDAKVEVAVVSEDVLPKPTRASVHEACEHFELPRLRLLEFLDEAGLLVADEEDDQFNDEYEDDD
jgi:hypothetical protein